MSTYCLLENVEVGIIRDVRPKNVGEKERAEPHNSTSIVKNRAGRDPLTFRVRRDEIHTVFRHSDPAENDLIEDNSNFVVAFVAIVDCGNSVSSRARSNGRRRGRGRGRESLHVRNEVRWNILFHTLPGAWSNLYGRCRDYVRDPIPRVGFGACATTSRSGRRAKFFGG